MKNPRRICAMLLILLLIFCSEGLSFAAKEASVSSSTTDKYNIMLLIDKSGSMNETDKLGLAKSAACQFVDQMRTVSNKFLDLSSATSIGVMSFDQKTELVAPIMSIDSEEKASYLKKQINSIQYLKAGTGGTDLSIAANDALKTLQQSPENEKKMVVLFTDGYSEFVNDKGEAEKALANAFSLADELSCEILVVGMNYKNKIREEGQQEIYNIANTTQIGEGLSPKAKNDNVSTKPLVNYLITDDIGKVREFYGRIYANMINSELVYIENHEFTVDSNGIFEVDITVYAASKIASVSIIDPNGIPKTKADEDYFEEGDDFYKVIKIVNPMVGTWKVDVSSKKDDYTSYVVQFYGMEIALSAESDIGKNFPEAGFKSPQIAKISLAPMYKGKNYEDKILEKESTKAYFTASKNGNSDGKKYDLVYKNGIFIGYFPVTPGIYDIAAHISNDIMNRSAKYSLEVPKLEQEVVNVTLLNTKIPNKGTKTIDLKNHIEDAENFEVEEINLSTKARKLPIDVQEKDGVLTISALKKGTANIRARVYDYYGTCYDIQGKVIVKFKMMWYHWSLILAIIAIAYLAYKKTRRIPGKFAIYAEIIDYDSEFKDFRGTSYIIKSQSPKGSSISLWDLVFILVGDIQDHKKDDEERMKLAEALLKDKNKIKKVSIAMATKKNGKNKQKIYKVIRKDGSRNLTTERTECFRDNLVSIEIAFEPLYQQNPNTSLY